MFDRLFLCRSVFSLLIPLTFPLPAQTDSPSNTAAVLQPREPFAINLPQIAIKTDDETGEFSGVSVIFPESGEQAIIGMGEDFEILSNSHGVEKTLYRKPPEQEGQFSKFEAKIIMRVNKRFCEALDTLEVLLREKKWNRCRYFDGYFPHFLSGWYYLICSARNSLHALPRSTRAPEKEFDVSLNSVKTDARIAVWSESSDAATALREAGRALGTQLKDFQKNLDTIKTREGPAVPKEFTDALSKFIRAYFKHAPPPSMGR